MLAICHTGDDYVGTVHPCTRSNQYVLLEPASLLLNVVRLIVPENIAATHVSCTSQDVGHIPGDTKDKCVRIWTKPADA